MRLGPALFTLVSLWRPPSEAHAANTTYPIAHFSDEFSAALTVEPKRDSFQKGAVSVFERRSGKRLLEVATEAFDFDVEDGAIAPNIRELPYGRQSVLIYDDFDFDGRKDLAIMDGQNSCYGGPSFQIFLREGRSFRKSRAFTRLAQEYCGMFGVDREKQRLSTMTKSGCCWHQYELYEVVRRAPRLLESVVEESVPSTSCYVKRVTRRRSITIEHFLEASKEEGSEAPCVKLLLGFDLAGPRRKRVEIFADGGSLDYALLVGPERRVEFSFRLDVASSKADARFDWNPTARELGFQNGAYRYVIHDGPSQLGISVHHRGRVVFLPGVEESRSQSLNGVRFSDFENAN